MEPCKLNGQAMRATGQWITLKADSYEVMYIFSACLEHIKDYREQQMQTMHRTLTCSTI